MSTSLSVREPSSSVALARVATRNCLDRLVSQRRERRKPSAPRRGRCSVTNALTHTMAPNTANPTVKACIRIPLLTSLTRYQVGRMRGLDVLGGTLAPSPTAETCSLWTLNENHRVTDSYQTRTRNDMCRHSLEGPEKTWLIHRFAPIRQGFSPMLICERDAQTLLSSLGGWSDCGSRRRSDEQQLAHRGWRLLPLCRWGVELRGRKLQ